MARRQFLFTIALLVVAPLLLCYGAALPLSVYLTIEGSPSTSMTIRWITDRQHSDDKVEYREGGYPDWKETIGSHIPMPDDHPYAIHYAQLNSLKPGTDYLFRLAEDGPLYKFQTLPSNLHEPIRFVVGGDLYHDSIEEFIQTNSAAAATDPHFAVLGGDIAYSAPNIRLYGEDLARWIAWLTAWSKSMVTRDGRIIPFLIAIGNHEVIGRYDQTAERAKFFYSLFKYPNQGGYEVINFDDYMRFWILDSGHTHPIDGKQKEWLESTLSEYQEIPHKFAIYHVPAYPSVRKHTGKVSKMIRETWTPIFETHGLNTAFENHDHAYKRTHPIFQGKIDASRGVLYMGDGAWGVKNPRTPKSPADLWYLAKTKGQRHFILVILYGTKRHYMAIDPEGAVFDYTSN